MILRRRRKKNDDDDNVYLLYKHEEYKINVLIQTHTHRQKTNKL